MSQRGHASRQPSSSRDHVSTDYIVAVCNLLEAVSHMLTFAAKFCLLGVMYSSNNEVFSLAELEQLPLLTDLNLQAG